MLVRARAAIRSAENRKVGVIMAAVIRAKGWLVRKRAGYPNIVNFEG
jgi:hypothetical protein